MTAWKKRLRRRGRRWPILLFLTGTLLSALGALWLLQNERYHLRQLTLLQLGQFSSAVDARVQAHTQAVERMARRWTVSGGTPEAVWHQDAETYTRYLEGIQAMGYLGPDLDLRWSMAATQDFNLRELDFSRLLASSGTLESTTTPSISDVYVTPAGEQVLFLSYPLYVNEHLDGFIVVSLSPDAILDQIARYVIGVNVNLEVTQDGHRIYQLVTDSVPEAQLHEQTQPLNLYNATWQMKAWPSQATANQAFSILPGIILLGGISLSALAAWLMWEMQTARLHSRMQQRLTQRLQRENRRRKEAENRFREVVDSAPFGVVLSDRDKRIQLTNEIACSMFGYSQKELMSGTVDMLIPERFRDFHLEQREQLINSTRPANYNFGTQEELCGLHRDGTEFPVELAIRPVQINGQMYLLTAIADIRERKAAQDRINQLNQELQKINYRLQAENEHRRQAEEELRRVNDILVHQASHDALTSLINRQEFTNRLSRAVQRAQDGHLYAFLYLDLDNFKMVNDTCGHNAGDRLLQNISALFSDHMRARDCLARLGGDEFGVLLENCTIDDAREVAGKILSSMHNFHFVCEGHHIPVGVSIGIAPVSRAFSHQEEVLKAADMACYLAKHRGRNRYEIYVPEQKEQLEQERDKSLTALITHSLDTGNLVLFAQPIVPLQPGTHSSHVELTVRLKDDTGKLRPARHFITTADRYKLTPDIDRWVVRHALQLLPQLNATHDPDFRLFVNLSSTSVEDREFSRFLEKALGTAPQLARQVAFELRETAVSTNLAQTRQFMQQFNAMGCEFAIDSFGSTLPTSSYLRSLPVHYLKIDEMYLRDLPKDGLETVLVSAMVEAGHTLGLHVIAKQVESGDVADVLRKMGVDYLGGYLTGRPELVPEPASQESP